MFCMREAMLGVMAMSNDVLGLLPSREPPARFVLWIDRVGAYVLCLGDMLTIGGPATEGKTADLSLLANLSRRHATLARSGERYVLYAHSPAYVAGRAVH